MVRLWCGTRSPVWTTKNPRVSDLGVSHGAGDENRTRAPSLGSDGARVVALALTCGYTLNDEGVLPRYMLLLTVVVRSEGHAVGTAR